MYNVVLRCFRLLLRLCVLTLFGCVLLVLRYIFRTPRALEPMLPGEAHLYKWTYGQVYYQILGSPDAPPLVLVHSPGIGASSYEMCDVIRGLAQSYRVYTLDLLGFGLSDAPTMEYTATTYVALLSDFLNNVVGQPAFLLASGLSCQYCAAVAATHPDRCRGLVLLSPLSLSSQRQRSAAVRVLASLPFFGLAIYELLALRFLLPVPAENGCQGQGREQRHRYRFAVAHQLNAHRAGLAFLAGKLAIAESATLFAAMTQPVLELWGTRKLRDVQTHALQEFATSRTQLVLLRDVGPHVMEERPEVVVTHVLAWQRQLDAAETNAKGEAEQREEAVERAEGVEEVREGEGIEAYCVRCREKRPMQNPKPTVTKNGRNALEGSCPICGTRLFRFVSNQKEESF